MKSLDIYKNLMKAKVCETREINIRFWGKPKTKQENSHEIPKINLIIYWDYRNNISSDYFSHLTWIPVWFSWCYCIDGDYDLWVWDAWMKIEPLFFTTWNIQQINQFKMSMVNKLFYDQKQRFFENQEFSSIGGVIESLSIFHWNWDTFSVTFNDKIINSSKADEWASAVQCWRWVTFHSEFTQCCLYRMFSFRKLIFQCF